MEPAKPIQIITPKEEDLKMINTKSFDIFFENKLFKLELAISENKKNIIFKLAENIKLIDNYYLLYLNLDDFYNKNVFFKLYQNVDEILLLLIDLIANRSILLYLEIIHLV